MKTQIFKSFSDFLDREDKTLNGVSESFAAENPNWEEERNNEGCWNCRYCRYCSDCRYCRYCSDCSGCRYCSDCSDCRDCSGCRYCSDCSDCIKKENVLNGTDNLVIPVIENIHAKVLEAVSQPGALNMSTWHACETTHCRAGWVVQLAGKEGKELEALTDTPFAAMQIYKASSPIRVSPTRFYEDAIRAMEDMKRCADEESKLTVQNEQPGI